MFSFKKVEDEENLELDFLRQNHKLMGKILVFKGFFTLIELRSIYRRLLISIRALNILLGRPREAPRWKLGKALY